MDLVVDFVRSSPHVAELNGDGLFDLLSGNTDGQLLLYPNVSAVPVPAFDGHEAVEADGVPINLPGAARSRPFVCDWNADGRSDVLIGAGDGLVRLFLGEGIPGDLNGDWVVDLADFAVFDECMAGPEVPTDEGSCSSAESSAADLDGDNDVDLADYLTFLIAYPG